MIKRLCFQNKKIFRNLDYKQLRKHEIMNKEGELLKTKYGDVFSINTGKFFIFDVLNKLNGCD